VVLDGLPRRDLVAVTRVDWQLCRVGRDRQLWRGWHVSVGAVARWSRATLRAYGRLVSGVTQSVTATKWAEWDACWHIRSLLDHGATLTCLEVRARTLTAVARWKKLRPTLREAVVIEAMIVPLSYMRRWRFPALERLTLAFRGNDAVFNYLPRVTRDLADTHLVGIPLTLHIETMFRECGTVLRQVPASLNLTGLVYHPADEGVTAAEMASMLSADATRRIDSLYVTVRYTIHGRAAEDFVAVLLKQATSLKSLRLRLSTIHCSCSCTHVRDKWTSALVALTGRGVQWTMDP
jgi:hypothetical protein